MKLFQNDNFFVFGKRTPFFGGPPGGRLGDQGNSKFSKINHRLGH